MAPCAVKILKTIATKPVVVDASKGVTMLKADPEESAEHAHDGEHPQGWMDPHIWLDFANAQIMVQNIADCLISKDPANRDFYAANAHAYQQRLAQLDDQYTQVELCRVKTLVRLI